MSPLTVIAGKRIDASSWHVISEMETTMTLPRTEIESGILSELDSFHELLETLDDRAWRTPSRCAGWTVANVAGHVVGSMADVDGGRLGGLGAPEFTDPPGAELAGRGRH